MASSVSVKRESKLKRDLQFEEIQKAQSAEDLLANPMLVDALKAIEAHYLSQILNSLEGEAELREVAFGMVRASQRFKQALTSFVESGSLAKFKIEEEQSQKDSLAE